MPTEALRKFAVLLIVAATLHGCGGGGQEAPTAPQVTTQPASVTAAEDSAAAFSVVASGTAPFTYQWQRNGVDIPGATGSSYTLPQALVGDDGASFTAVVRNGSGSVTSAAAVLYVNGASNAQALGTAGGALALSSNGVQVAISVPAGALVGDTAFTVRSVPPVGKELARIAVSPAGVAFAVPVTVTMTPPAARAVTARYVGALEIGAKKTYVPSTVNVAARTVTLQLSYFGMNGTAAPSRWGGLRPQALSARALAAPAPQPSNTLTLEELAILQPQKAALDAALVDLQFQHRFEDAAALQLSIAALEQSAQVPEWQTDTMTFIKQASVTVCGALVNAMDVAEATTVSNYGDYQRVAKDVVYWAGASEALGADGCIGMRWMDTLHHKLTQSLDFVAGVVRTAPPPTGYGPVAGEIRAANSLATEAGLLRLPAVATDTRALYVDPALRPLRAAAFETSITSPDQSEYLQLLGVFGPTQSLSDDAQYAATTFTVTSKSATGDIRGTQAMGRGSSVGAPVRTATMSATTDGSVQIAGSIAVLHCPNPAVERLQVLFEGVEVATLPSSTDDLLSPGHTLPVLQVSALLRAAGIDPAKATRHLLQIKRKDSSCITSFAIFDEVLAAVTLSFSNRKIVFTRDPLETANGARLGTEIASINEDGTGLVRLTSNPPELTPDGEGGSIWQTNSRDDSPAASLDGRRIAFVKHGPLGTLGSGAYGADRIMVMNADGSSAIPIATTPCCFEQYYSPSWSPDGTRIAYVRRNSGVFPRRLTIVVMSADGGGSTELNSHVFSGMTGSLSWSPDGKSIAYAGAADDFGATPGIYVVKVDGSGPGTLLVADTNFSPSISASGWSPDGRKILFTGFPNVNSTDSWGMWVMYLDNSAITRVATADPISKQFASWSPDGTRIVYERAGELWVMNADGSNPKLVINEPNTKSQPSWR